MAGYNTIRGLRVKYLSADPAGAEDGQVWYNSTTGNLRVDGILGTASWASSGNMSTARAHIGGAGSESSGLAFGGEGAPTGNTNSTEQYNGSAWTGGGNYPSEDESIMACGLTESTTLAFGGINNASPGVRQATSVLYNGTAWTATNSLPTAKRAGQGFGVSTAAVCMGGDSSPTAGGNTVEEWDGTNWGAVPTAPFTKGNMGGGTGTLTAGLVFGGADPSNTAATYEYDGTNWTAGGSMGTARNTVNGFGGPAGQTASICAGGDAPPFTAATEVYNGTSWAATASLATARSGSANGIGVNTTAGVQAGGYTGSYTVATEEFTGATTQIENITTS